MKKRYLYHTLMVGMALMPAIALAQEAVPQPDYAPKPLVKLDVGGQAGLGYHDNLFRADTGRTNDAYLLFAPAMRLRTYYDETDVSSTLKFEAARFIEQEQSEYLDVDWGVRAAQPLNETTDIILRTRLRKDHVDIGAFDDDPDLLADDVTDYRSAWGELGVDHEFSQWKGYAGVEGMALNYDNVNQVGTGELIVNDDRDRVHSGVNLRADVPFDEYYGLYSLVRVNRRNYDQQIDSTAANPRDSEGIEWLAGFTFGNKKQDNVYGEVGAGLLSQDYDDPFYPDVDTFGLRGDVSWHPDEESRIRLDFQRAIQEVTTSGASSYVMTAFRLRGHRWVSPDWRLGAEAQYRRNDFQVNPLASDGRVDDLYQLGTFAEYAAWERMNLGVSLQRQVRESDEDNFDYTRHIMLMYVSAPY